MRYVIDIEKAAYDIRSFYVEAENKKKAEEKALKIAMSVEWNIPDKTNSFNVLNAEEELDV